MESKQGDIEEAKHTVKETERRSETSVGASGNSLSLSWAFGFNKEVTGCVHNLSDDTRNAFFFISAHSGVIYDYVSRQQHCLQGHCNPISCSSVSADKRWIVTGDKGEDSLVVIWDSLTGTPIKTIFSPHPQGVIDLEISPDAMFLVTLSAMYEDNGKLTQDIAVWEWTTEREGPLYIAPIKVNDSQHKVKFNTYDIREIVTTGERRIVFWDWSAKKLDYYIPSINRNDFKQGMGNFEYSIFLPNSKQAVTSTSTGSVILWDKEADDSESKYGGSSKESKYEQDFDLGNIDTSGTVCTRRSLVKMVELNNSGSIPFMTLYGSLLAVCGEDQSVRLYDFQFRIIAWFEDLEAGEVMSISFANSSNKHPFPSPSSLVENTDDSDNGYHVPDFIVSTRKGLIVGVDAACFDEHTAENRRGTLLLQGFDSDITALAANPVDTTLFAVTESGLVQAWDYESKCLLMVRAMPANNIPQSIAVSKDGAFVIIGCKSGHIRILRWGKTKDLGETACFRVHPNIGYTQLRFSPENSYLACADAENCVSLFQFLPEETVPVDEMEVNRGKEKGDPGPGLEPSDGTDPRNGWTYIGRYRSHKKQITCLDFDYSTSGALRLVSVGADSRIVAYDVEGSSVVDGIQLVDKPTIAETRTTLTACLIHPNTRGLKEDLIITADDEFKFKIWNANNMSCRKTTLGPTYGGPLSKLKVIQQQDGTGTYIAYATQEKVIGLTKLPLDGNPHRAMGLIAHPGEISGFDVTYDGRYVITAGGGDLTINMWAVNTSALDAALLSVPCPEGISPTLSPYLTLLEGGHDGILYQEIVDYFYYSQLRSQGEDTTSPRKITGNVPISEIPNLMRAIGFYPTESQIKNMCSEIKYSNYTSTGKPNTSINLEQFIKLYVNHRPVYGIGKEQIREAFSIIIQNGRLIGDEKIQWSDLENILQKNGERMTKQELGACLNSLVSYGSNEIPLSKYFTSDSFSHELLGFQEQST